jgi:tetratricopeptide (TPR) repeat protein
MSETLQEAFQFYKRGEKQKATKLLAALVIQEPNNASAWMGLGVCLDNKEKQIYCFQKVLSLDPQNSQAKEMLEQLSPDPETEKCPHCGESIYEESKICQSCGRDLHVRSEVEPEISKDSYRNRKSSFLKRKSAHIVENLFMKEQIGAATAEEI